MYPTTLVPLLPHIESGIPVNKEIKGYISSLSKSDGKSEKYVFERIKRSQEPQMIYPWIYEFSKRHNYDANSLAYFVYELIANIREHSDFTTAFAMAQSYGGHNNFLEFCLYDDGITIPESLRRSDASFKFLDDCVVINEALNGESSKKKDKGRGHGMNTSAQVVVDGYKGELFIASSNGSINIKSGTERLCLYNTQKYCKIEGTLISLRIPHIEKEVPEKKVSVYTYVEKIRKFKGEVIEDGPNSEC
ncbi:MAG: hypothetical protein FWE54_00765 [Methanimicrococcus sp.]|nr:hypothetical protein [Methanimicrococcus sp.]